jgi:catechol 2,3-dioxygenase-like lactoylglutathione lyase family enzyme
MGLDAIGIVSADLERSLHFYRLLGVEFARAGDSEHFEAATPTGGVRLMLDSVALVQKFEPDFKKVRGSGFSLCFKQETRNKVDEVYGAITAAGFQGKKAPWDAFWGQRYACVLDPDGNQIDLFAE